MSDQKYVIGIDFGTDSVRAILVSTQTGEILATEVFEYPRWKAGLYCDPLQNQFRQHPQDHLEGLEQTVKAVVSASGINPDQIVGIGIDTTGSSPMAVDRAGKPLALLPEFSENPNAMLILWKDHTAIQEAEQINQLARTWGGVDFTQYSGGIYSSEWFWSKILHVIRKDPEVAKAAYSWMEHCDIIAYELTGATQPEAFRRSRCAAGHKAMWHEHWGGLPDSVFLEKLDPRLAALKDRLYKDTFTSDQPAGRLSESWAGKLGLSTKTIVAVGTIDAHAGAVGGQISPNTLVKVMGTSTCDIMVTSHEEIGGRLVKGICGQVDGSVLPGLVGLEAGQSAFGDMLAWFRDMISQPTIEIIQHSHWLDGRTKEQLVESIKDDLLSNLSRQAMEIPVTETAPVALDWINGRRTPDANPAVKAAIMGINQGTDAARILKAIVDALCFGSRKIVERLKEEGVTIDAVIAMGGVAKRSPLVMQTMADVLSMPIKVAASEQAPALGAAMYAAAASQAQPDLATAIATMGGGFDQVYQPIPLHTAHYEKLYRQYLGLGDFVEKETASYTH